MENENLDRGPHFLGPQGAVRVLAAQTPRGLPGSTSSYGELSEKFSFAAVLKESRD